MNVLGLAEVLFLTPADWGHGFWRPSHIEPEAGGVRLRGAADVAARNFCHQKWMARVIHCQVT